MESTKATTEGGKMVYQYHWESLKYLGSKPAAPNPMDKGNFLLPANATFVKPPGRKTTWQNYKWNGSAWVKIEEEKKKTTGRGKKKVAAEETRDPEE